METWHYTTTDANGNDVDFSVEAKDEAAAHEAADAVARENGWDVDGIEDSPYHHDA